MRFGIFDHLDDSGVPLNRHFEDRLKLIEAYDRAGFYGYHLAEHHNTPLGYAPSPSVFLAAVAQRTTALRFGPMVYLLPLYHPLRLIDEICMLDQMSGGRFMYGVGRGISPVEVGFYGIDFATGAAQFREAFDAIRIGLTEDELTYHGKFYDFDHVPIAMKPFQKPYPELWYGLGNPASVPWAAANAANTVTRRPPEQVRAITDSYRAEWKKLGRTDADLPLLGVNRHIIIADTEERRSTPRGAAIRRGVAIWASCGINITCRSRSKRRCPRILPYCRSMATRSPARPLRCAITSPAKSRRPASTTMSATSPLARSAMTRRCARSRCLRGR